MRHPLEKASLAPYGFVFPFSQARLQYRHPTRPWWIDPEKLILKFWDQLHRLDTARPLPIHTIIHEVLPARLPEHAVLKGDFEFDGRPYLSRDIRILSSVVQWFGTSCGRVFLEDGIQFAEDPHPHDEFLLQLAKSKRLGHDLVRQLTHRCTDRCVPSYAWVAGTAHDYVSVPTLERDRALADALMFWLGTVHGRAFIRDWVARKKKVQDALGRRSIRRFKLRKVA